MAGQWEYVLVGNACRRVLRREYLEIVRQIAIGIDPYQAFRAFPARPARGLERNSARDSLIRLSARQLLTLTREEAARYYKDCTAYDASEPLDT